MAIKVGADDRKKVAIAGSLGLVALLLAARTLFGGPDTPAVAPPQPVPVSSSPAVSSTSSSTGSLPAGATSTIASASRAGSVASPATLDPTLHPELMAENEAFVYAGSGRNIFSPNGAPAAAAAIKIEKPKGPIRPTAAVYTPPPGPPPPPAIDLKFFGYSAQHDGSRKAFLLHGDDVFIAAEGDVVSHRYRVVRIAVNSVTVEDLPYHNTQSLPLIVN